MRNGPAKDFVQLHDVDGVPAVTSDTLIEDWDSYYPTYTGLVYEDGSPILKPSTRIKLGYI